MLFCAWYGFLITILELIVVLVKDGKSSVRLVSIVLYAPIIVFYVKFIFGV